MSAVFDLRGLPETRKMLAEYEGKELYNKERRAVAAGAKVFQAPLAAAARAHHGGAENVPASFAKVPAPRRSTHGGLSGHDPTATVRPKSPLFNIFEPGAGAHTIAPRHGDLAGAPGEGSWTKEGRKRRGGFYARGAVRHPGMSARPLLPGVFAAHLGEAEDAAANVIFGHAVGAVE